MKKQKDGSSIRTFFSLEPLLYFWRKQIVPGCSDMAEMFSSFEKQIKETPEIQGKVKDVSVLDKYQDIMIPLMSVVFPPASWETDLVGALVPFTSQAIYASPGLQGLIGNEKGLLKGSIKDDESMTEEAILLQAYHHILYKIYGINVGIETRLIGVVPDDSTGLDRYYRVTADKTFVKVNSVGVPRELTEEDRAVLAENLTDIEVLSSYIDINKFEFMGFKTIRAVDVTESEVIATLEKDLTDQISICSTEGFRRIQGRLQVLFGRPHLRADIGALMKDQILIIDAGCHESANCLFTSSKHVPLEELEGSVWVRATEKGRITRVPDLKTEPNRTLTEDHALSLGARSMIISPLFYQGEVIGTFDLVSPIPGDLGPEDLMLVRKITPLFTMALKRSIDEMSHEVQGVIKEKCTAVHPSVEWRFQEAALKHMDRLRHGAVSEMEPIIFRSVIPFYGQSDIRGSSEARNKSVQEDLIEQLTLAGDVMKWAGETRPWPLIKEFEYRINRRIDDVRSGLSSGDEASIAHFVGTEIEPAFEELSGFGPRIVRAIDKYQKAVDPALGVVYKKRKEFEESVSRLNETLSAYLEKEEEAAQSIVPHYFEKHQTDGLDYIIYAGSSMIEDGDLNDFHLKNIFLWQIMTACGLALGTEKAKKEIKIPLDTCHLILVNQAPLSIRFRYDEKRFDVDGAYDVRHEIIKSRIDKAVIKGTRERLTQPGKIAIVYSHPEEEKEALRHIEFLQAKERLLEGLEILDIEDLPGVRGLKALRVGINLEAEAAGLFDHEEELEQDQIGTAA